jgi:hypothetical protein
VVEKNPRAIILPIDRGRVWLVEQFRYIIGERALEFPQGYWETADVDPRPGGTRSRGAVGTESGSIDQQLLEPDYRKVKVAAQLGSLSKMSTCNDAVCDRGEAPVAK